MTKKKVEAIKYLFSTYSDISPSKIERSLDPELYEKFRIRLDNKEYSEFNIKNYLMFLYTSYFYQNDEIDELLSRSNAIRRKILDYTRELSVLLDEAISMSKVAAISDKSNMDIVKTIYYTPSSGYDIEKTNSYVEKSLISSPQDDTTSDYNQSASVILKRDISVSITNGPDRSQCTVKDFNNSTLLESDSLINSGKKFIVDGYMSENIKADIEFLIDRKEYSFFNNIQANTDVPHLYTLYTSEDGAFFDKINSNPILTSNLNIQIDKTNHRFIKIVVHMPRATSSNSNGFLYRIKFNSMLLKVSQYKNVSTFFTGDINVDSIGEYVAIDTCDNYQNKNVKINYQISINGGQFRSIKPLRKISIYEDGLISSMPISDYLDYKIAHLTEHTSESNRNIFDTSIDVNIFNSSRFRYFSPNHRFVTGGNYTSVTGILYEDREYDFGQVGVVINGIVKTGKVKIYAGVNTIEFPSHSFNELFNIDNIEEAKIDGNRIIIYKDGEIVNTIFDVDSYKNGFFMSIDIFGAKAILGKEVTDEIHIIDDTDGLYVSSPNDVNSLYILMKNKISNIDTVNLKIDMKSMDTFTRPEINRIIFRVI